MRARLTAGLIALVILVTGVVPAVAGYRCVMTGMRMEAQSACCQHRNVPEQPALKAQCCESFAAPRLEARRAPPASEIMIHAPTLIAWIIPLPPAPIQSALGIASATHARGRPPGERLHLFSSILRV
jgi:hypothetical protein